MEFKSLDRKELVFLPRRSLCVMAGKARTPCSATRPLARPNPLPDEARYGWTHGISERKSDLVDGHVLRRGVRVSLTLRRVRTQPCACQWKTLCDSWLADPSSSMLPVGQQLEDAHVHDVYDAIASEFSLTRHTPWPKVCQFVNDLPPWAVVYDVGCGNGRYLQQRRDIIALALDRCSGFARLCASASLNSAQADCLHLPLRSESCDALLSIAVLHHVSTSERRAKAV
jgi:alkylated DNA repair protein alkB family protein 8